jgi:hypothetical protein
MTHKNSQPLQPNYKDVDVYGGIEADLSPFANKP